MHGAPASGSRLVPAAGNAAPAGVPPGPRELAILAIALVLGLAIRLVQIGFSFDTDEAFSAGIASRDFTAMVAGALDDRTHPPLHLLLLHGWMQLFGPSEAAARVLSLCAWAGFMVVAWRILRRYATGFVLAGAMLLFAASPLYVYYGAMVRPYALVMLASALLFERYLALVDAPDDRFRRWTWALACAAAMATQYLAAPLVAACMAASLTRGRHVAVPTIAFGAAGALTVAPWLATAMLVASGGKPLIELIDWMVKPTLEGFAWFYAEAFGVPDWGRLVYLLPVALVLAWLPLAAAARTSPVQESDRRRRHDVLLWALAAFAVPLSAFLVSVLSGYTVLVTRQLLGSQFALIVLVVLGLRLMPRPVAGVAVLALLGWTAASTPFALPGHTRPDWREIAAVVRAAERPYVAGELWVQWPLEYYVGAPALRVGPELGPVATDHFVIVCREPGCTEIRRQAREGWHVGSIATFETAPRRRESLRMRVEVLTVAATRP